MRSWDLREKKEEVEITLELPEERSLFVDIKVLSKDDVDFFLDLIETYVEV